MRLRMDVSSILTCHQIVGIEPANKYTAHTRETLSRALRKYGVPLCVVCSLLMSNLSSAPAAKNDKEIAPGLTYDAYLTNEFVTERNYDLNRSTHDGQIAAEPEAGLSLLYDPGHWLRAFVEIELSRRDFLENDQNKAKKGWEFQIKEAYFDLSGLENSFTFRIGRQKFKDKMEWLYDEELDGVRLFLSKGPLDFQLSASRRNLVDGDLLNPDKRNIIDNYFALARYNVSKKTTIDSYVLYRDEHSFRGNVPEDLLFIGMQSVGEIGSMFDYWLNAAYVTGDRAGRKISGYGFDAGVIWTPGHPIRPSVTLGIAHGSGDADPNSGKDKNFRQTGLHDNNFKFNGVTRFKYLGEVTEPEVSNMTILTAGVGIRPSERSSLDLVYHYYQQVELARRLRDTNIDKRPNRSGMSKDLGHEFDVIFGFREIENVNIEAVFGVFFPGAAFSPGADNAYFGTFKVSFGF